MIHMYGESALQMGMDTGFSDYCVRDSNIVTAGVSVKMAYLCSITLHIGMTLRFIP
jgi:hypothetical protein